MTLNVWPYLEMKRAREFYSPSLEADAPHLTIDLFSSCIILVGLTADLEV